MTPSAQDIEGRAIELYEEARDKRGRAEEPGNLGYGMPPWDEEDAQDEWREYAAEQLAEEQS